MAQILIVGYSCQLVFDYLLHLFLNAVIVGVYHIPHTILTILVRKVGNDRYTLVIFHISYKQYTSFERKSLYLP